MSGFWPLFKRELFALFVTPLAWVLMTVFLVVQGMHFFLILDQFSAAGSGGNGDQLSLEAFFGNTIMLYLILFLLVPPMTMRLFAEERRSGTIESLLAPLAIPAMVLAKYAASLVTYVAMWTPTLLYLVILKKTGTIDLHVAAASYLGVLLVGAGYLAVGLFMSALTRSQFLALIATALVLLALFLVGMGEFVTREGTTVHDVCVHLSVWAAMNDFASGIIDSRRLVWAFSLIALPLFATVRAVRAWRWS